MPYAIGAGVRVSREMRAICRVIAMRDAVREFNALRVE